MKEMKGFSKKIKLKKLYILHSSRATFGDLPRQPPADTINIGDKLAKEMEGKLEAQERFWRGQMKMYKERIEKETKDSELKLEKLRMEILTEKESRLRREKRRKRTRKSAKRQKESAIKEGSAEVLQDTQIHEETIKQGELHFVGTSQPVAKTTEQNLSAKRRKHLGKRRAPHKVPELEDDVSDQLPEQPELPEQPVLPAHQAEAVLVSGIGSLSSQQVYTNFVK